VSETNGRPRGLSEKDLRLLEVIDLQRLDLELAEQSRLCLRAGEAEAQARRDYNNAEKAKKLLRAELRLKVRKRPEKYGWDKKPTKDEVDDLVEVQAPYQAAEQDVIDRKYDLDIMSTAVRAVEHRKKLLENEVQLVVRDYHSEPRTAGYDRGAGELAAFDRATTRKGKK
jgi:hypothetical protein